MSIFKLHSLWKPAGDQPAAISKLVEGLSKGMEKQTLLGATGTGKTFTMANVIAEYNKPTLVIAHNKTLAAQLAQEFKLFFPDAAVHYFVSYYDYYQPEAYMPTSDTYIEKDASINKEIDMLRHASTQALLTRPDVIIVASVSCIYGLGSPAEYEKVNLKLEVGQKMERMSLMKALIKIHFERTNADLTPGTFRSLGSRVEFIPVSETVMYQIEMSGGVISKIIKVDPVSSQIIKEEKNIFIFPAKHFITEDAKLKQALKNIKEELAAQLKKFKKEDKLLEAERIKRRTNYDLAMIKEVGYCSGIENYSRHLSGKKEGEPPETLLSYFPKTSKKSLLVPDFLTIIDESHVTLPQLQGMYVGDASRKNTLVEYGFRLPSAKDNRPLKYEEFKECIGPVIYTSATPGKYEIEESKKACEQTCPVRSTLSCGVVEQIIRPTGLVDPEVIVRPVSASGQTFVNGLAGVGDPENRGPEQKTDHLPNTYPGQIQDFIAEAEKTIGRGFRVLATTLTKKMAEDLSVYLKEKKIKAEYLHSDIKTMDRIKILTRFRRGGKGEPAPYGVEDSRLGFDVLVGVNLLREGLDLPEVALIGILGADKAGFLRSETSLIQTIGRAARNSEGRVILYGDILTDSMNYAIKETTRRRNIQLAYNKKHGITPKTIMKKIRDITEELESEHGKAVNAELKLDLEIFTSEQKKYTHLSDQERDALVYEKIIKIKEKEMNQAVKELDFESAAILRDEIGVLKLRLEKEG
ncbi:excinuclease ABC subunit B [Candidatus Nomurabacteria bacterium RIFCSPHIGHO2_01_FULL_39_220]|uniref:UvrABC system protein B n=1 Tax=Candidatus Nomurabacteria bacterium RIFCSPLOWO2_02_FULL_40_67 TaxID=1801787 RepID=A0A1F6Y4F9_9BACT|nr:MAG: UvrABC system protein B [Parcubacteria group bacterium GW2011_GWA2_40_37]OGI62985.1 MAG: excinuclease ABC subunit B [Candidatus Nomurabacteria bacterium RBG_16_40_11]OGI69645.1 MAG: excinuclease ABC subunit B [Candidatus Nomurabacteria bacterium RIFCSPHIGHO2_01_FULL_39_220]OGI72133.1 MAG: excinuclease ABC subunit B [Candidatus Nomurabacteria bacterium RIFCSPHIGHO2_02_41_18]OGI78400.1 MAG: excinuclease ABC subunit B [Candidatus Nomurabacteria bacterium RIFCSPHIGHO2_02_FULL_41_150]OGI813